jgi:ankyrin repeat protein
MLTINGPTPLPLPPMTLHRKAVVWVVILWGVGVCAAGCRNQAIHLRTSRSLPECIFASVRAGDLLVVEALLNENPQRVNQRDEDGRTPLIYAAWGGDLRISELLVNRGADIEAQDRDGRGPLLYAVDGGHDTVTSFLLGKGARIQDPSIILNAARWPGVLNLVIQAGADVRASGRYGRTALHYAADAYAVEAIGLLLEHGSDPNAQDQNGMTALHYWALDPPMHANRASYESKAREAISILLSSRANIDAKAADGHTPLSLAVERSTTGIVRYLLENGANPNRGADPPPLHAATFGLKLDIVEILIAHGADVKARDRYDSTVLHWLAWSCGGPQQARTREHRMVRQTIGRLLLGHGAELKAENALGETAVEEAARQKCLDLIRLFHSWGRSHAR